MAKKDSPKAPVLKVHRTSEDRTSVVDRLIDAGFEVLQTKLGVQISFGDGQTMTFKLVANAVGAQGFAEVAVQARSAEGMFSKLAAILETPETTPGKEDITLVTDEGR